MLSVYYCMVRSSLFGCFHLEKHESNSDDWLIPESNQLAKEQKIYG